MTDTSPHLTCLFKMDPFSGARCISSDVFLKPVLGSSDFVEQKNKDAALSSSRREVFK